MGEQMVEISHRLGDRWAQPKPRRRERGSEGAREANESEEPKLGYCTDGRLIEQGNRAVRNAVETIQIATPAHNKDPFSIRCE
jgi:hypothetical protein